MKTNVALKFSLPTILAALLVWIVGCATTPPVDWDSRVGNYTYDQAVVDMGPPDKKETLTGGTIVAECIKHRSGGASVGLGMGYANTAAGVGVGSGRHDQVLKLIFATDGKLSSWSKTY